MGILLVNVGAQMIEAVKKTVTVIHEELTSADNYNSGIDEIHKLSPDVIVCINDPADEELSGFLRKIKNLKNTYPGVLLVSTKDDVARLLDERMEFDDLIIKPFTRDELLLRIEKVKNISLLKKQAHKSRKNMLTLSKEDPHTGFLNRRAILDEALKEMNRSSREDKHMSAIMVNIANYKYFSEIFKNDSLENLFLEFSRRIFKSCRPYDKIGRYGISQFLILLPDAAAVDAQKVAKRIIASAAVKNIQLMNEKINLELEIGIAELNPHEVAKNKNIDDSLMNELILDSLLRRTEVAMNKSQKKGSNSIEVYTV